MHPFRFLHAADLHLDSPFKGLAELPSAVRGRIRESTFAALRRLVDIAIAERVAFVLISGDVYDLADRSLRAQLRFQQAAFDLAEQGIPLYVIHGNHDPAEGVRASLSWPQTVHFFRSDEVETVECRDAEGRTLATISGISYAKAAVADDLAARFPRPRYDAYAIAMLHTNVDGDKAHDNYAPCSKEQLVRSGYQYWALGHIHTRHVLHDGPFIVYPGNTQGRSVKETGDKGCYIAEVAEDGGTRLTFYSTAAVVWERCSIRIEELRNEQELKEQMEDAIAGLLQLAEGRPVVARMTLTGRGPLHAVLQQGGSVQELVAELREEQTALAERGEPFVWIESCRTETGADLPFDRLLEQDSFVGDLLRLSERLLADDAALAAFAADALAPMATHVKAGKYMQADDAQTLKEWLSSARELALDELVLDEFALDELTQDEFARGERVRERVREQGERVRERVHGELEQGERVQDARVHEEIVTDEPSLDRGLDE